MAYREIRVRPVVRFIVTDFQRDDTTSPPMTRSLGLGIFENPDAANRVARALAAALRAEGHETELHLEPHQGQYVTYTK